MNRTSNFKPAESNFKYDYYLQVSTIGRSCSIILRVYKKELEFYDSTLGLNNNKNFRILIADPIKRK